MKQEPVLLMVSEFSVHGYSGEVQKPLSRSLSLQSHILPVGPTSYSSQQLFQLGAKCSTKEPLENI